MRQPCLWLVTWVSLLYLCLYTGNTFITCFESQQIRITSVLICHKNWQYLIIAQFILYQYQFLSWGRWTKNSNNPLYFFAAIFTSDKRFCMAIWIIKYHLWSSNWEKIGITSVLSMHALYIMRRGLINVQQIMSYPTKSKNKVITCTWKWPSNWITCLPQYMSPILLPKFRYDYIKKKNNQGILQCRFAREINCIHHFNLLYFSRKYLKL